MVYIMVTGALAAVDLQSTYKRSRSEGFGKEVKRAYNAGYICFKRADIMTRIMPKPQKARRLIREKTEEYITGIRFYTYTQQLPSQHLQ